LTHSGHSPNDDVEFGVHLSKLFIHSGIEPILYLIDPLDYSRAEGRSSTNKGISNITARGDCRP
jgi:hypothetical protein